MVKIERIQNSYLYQKYTVRKIQMVTKNKGVVNERLLFHGTFCFESNTHSQFMEWKYSNTPTQVHVLLFPVTFGTVWMLVVSILVSEKDITESVHTSQRKLHTVWLTSTEVNRAWNKCFWHPYCADTREFTEPPLWRRWNVLPIYQQVILVIQDCMTVYKEVRTVDLWCGLCTTPTKRILDICILTDNHLFFVGVDCVAPLSERSGLVVRVFCFFIVE